MVNPGLEDIKGASFNFDFSYERKVDREAAAADAKGDARNSSGSSASSLQVRMLLACATKSICNTVELSIAGSARIKVMVCSAGGGSLDAGDFEVHRDGLLTGRSVHGNGCAGLCCRQG